MHGVLAEKSALKRSYTVHLYGMYIWCVLTVLANPNHVFALCTRNYNKTRVWIHGTGLRD
jgi:hypothetical protein